MSRYRFTTLVLPSRAPDGDTIYASALDFGQGHTLRAPSDAPFALRLVGPGGEWFDAAESRGRYAQPAGRRATEMMRTLLEPVLSGELWIACETFPAENASTRDRFGRYLYRPFAAVDADNGYALSPWDPCTVLVEAGVATLGRRYPRPE